jgi:tetraacyldisaccharide 4'-kinase
MSQDKGQARWQAIWRTRNGKALALLPIAWVYGALVHIRHWLYAHQWLPVHRVNVPVVVVGNVVVGGAGKTPTVLALLHHLKTRGWHPGVISRGYGRDGDAPLEVLPSTPPSACGDEPALIRRQAKVPVVVARQRAEAAKALLSHHPDVDLIVCDDGLQHLALGRDLAIAVFDDRGTGNGWLLPAGLLREPWPARAGNAFAPDFVLHQSTSTQSTTRCPAAHFTAQRALSPEATNALGERQTLSALKANKLTAVAGIARPKPFFDMLEAAGLSLQRTVALPDHANEATYIAVLHKLDGLLICTEKDAVKLFELVQQRYPAMATRIWTVPLVLRVDPEFFSAVDNRLSALGLN